MTERFPFGPSTRPDPPLFSSWAARLPRSARSGPGREAAKRTLDGEDRSGIIQSEGKGGFLPTGAPRHFHRSVSLPSAPLGLSVCLEPCKGHKSPISTGLCESRQFSTTFHVT